MKKLLLTLCISVSFCAPFSVSAHDLIPQELKAYVQTHPQATPAEILQFANNQNPEYAKKFRDGAEIIRIAQDQTTSFLDNLIDFFKLGVAHILSGPDHILFVLSLLLVFVGWKDILKFTTTFTVAHSITLVLAGTGLLTISSKIVEPMIALSIFYVAITSVFWKGASFFGENKGKLAAIFFFGLFHGLGFAGLLKEIQVPADKFVSSLFAFNVGIEGGQLIIVAIAFPFIYLCREKVWYPQAIKIFASIIASIALFWFVQRVFFGISL